MWPLLRRRARCSWQALINIVGSTSCSIFVNYFLLFMIESSARGIDNILVHPCRLHRVHLSVLFLVVYVCRLSSLATCSDACHEFVICSADVVVASVDAVCLPFSSVPTRIDLTLDAMNIVGSTSSGM